MTEPTKQTGEAVQPHGEGDASADAAAHMVFRVSHAWLAIAAGYISEIADATVPAVLPGAPPHIPGVINLRGAAVPLLELRLFLDLPAPTEEDAEVQKTQQRRVLVVRVGAMTVGLLADAVRGIFPIPESDQHDVEVTRGTRLKEHVSAEWDSAQGLVALLDLEKILDAARVRG